MATTFRTLVWALAILLHVALMSVSRADIVDFQDKAPDLTSVTAVGDTAFFSNGVFFSSMNQPFGSGFAYSRVSDLSDTSFMNPYASVTGAGTNDAYYGVYFGYKDGLPLAPPALPTLAELEFEDLIFPNFILPLHSITAPAGTSFQSFWVNNTLYTDDVIRNGSSFGGNGPFDAGDFFRLTIYGVAPDGTVIGSIDVDLADFTNGNNFIMSDWTEVDVSSLSQANRLFFDLTSSDFGSAGMNTPGYFAIDDIEFNAVPEPGTFALGFVGLALVAGWRMRRRKALDAACVECPPTE